MTILQVILIISGTLFCLMAIDAYKRGKMTLIHFIVFGVGGLLVGWSTIDDRIITKIAQLFGGATAPTDIIVYLSIIFLVYSYFELVNKITKDNYNQTRLITEIALQTIQIDKPLKHTTEKDSYMFLVRGYNEGKVIASTLQGIINAGYHKILVVNDGSQDNTVQEVERIQQSNPDASIFLVSHLINRKHGAGNKTGIEFFRRYGSILSIKYVVFFDADGQMDISDMEAFHSYIQQHPTIDVIQGSRFIEGGKAESIPLHRQIILRGANIVTRCFNGMKVTDPHNGYKVFALSALQKITIHTDTASYANELIDQYQQHHLSYAEIPVHIKYTEYSLKKGQKSSNAINILLELIYKKIFFR